MIAGAGNLKSIIFLESKSSLTKISRTSASPCSTVARMSTSFSSKSFLTSLIADVFGETAISIPTFSKRGIFNTLETLEITRFTPNCLTRSEHKRFLSSLFVTEITTSLEPISSSSKSFRFVPSPFITRAF